MFIDYPQALEIILNQGVVAVPTETVYGLAGDATSEIATSKIFTTKKRPADNPLIIHISSLDQAMEYGVFNEYAKKIATAFWPGPITIVVPKKKSRISAISTAGMDTIALRWPSHPTMQKLIIDAQKPIAAPSANIYTRISPTSSKHVEIGFDGAVPVLDGGIAVYGIESTIISCSTKIAILRHGFITSQSIEDVVGITPEIFINSKTAPGASEIHYSPMSEMRVDVERAHNDEFAINFGSNQIGGSMHANLSNDGDLVQAASRLYNALFEADKAVQEFGLSSIAVAKIPYQGIGHAINDKLRRGARTQSITNS